MPSANAAAMTDLADLGLDEGGHLLVDRGLGGLTPGQRRACQGHLGTLEPSEGAIEDEDDAGADGNAW